MTAQKRQKPGSTPTNVKIILSRQGGLWFAHIGMTSGYVPRAVLETIARDIAGDIIVFIHGADCVRGKPCNDNNSEADASEDDDLTK